VRRAGLLLLLAGGAGGEEDLPARTGALLSEIESVAEAEREGGRGAEADALETEVRALRRRIAERGSPAPSTEPETHVVYVRNAPDRIWRRAIVRVTLRSRPVVLVLGCSGPVTWQVDAEGANLRKILTFGDPECQVVAKPEAPVEMIRQQRFDHRTPGYETLARQVEEATGGAVATFLGVEALDPEKPFVLGPGNPEWLAQHALAEAARLHWRATRARRAALREELRGARFRFLYRWMEGKRLHASFGDWTPLGPLLARQVVLDSLVAPSSAAVEDAGREELYLLRAGALIRYPLATRQPEVLHVPDTLPEEHGRCALAIDTRRDRLLLATRDDIGYLYALDLARRKWSVVNDLGGVDARGMAYDERRDAVLLVERGKDGTLTLHRFSPEEGRRLHSTPLLVPPIREERPMAAACRGGRLILLYPPPEASAHRIGTDAMAYVVEPHTGNLLFASRVRPWEDFEPLPRQRFAELWDGLLSTDEESAGHAMRTLAGQGDAAVSFLVERFTPDPGTAEDLGRWVRMLSDDDTLARDLAQHRLVLAGPRAEEFLAGLDLDGLPPEARRRVVAALRQVEEPGRLRRSLRAILALEAIETPAAEALLRQLAAKGDGRRAEAAAAALRRMGVPRR
jgi:hypothetical protein